MSMHMTVSAAGLHAREIRRFEVSALDGGCVDHAV